MRLLFITHRIPYPPNKGEKIRAYHILRHLGARHDVHLAFIVDDKNDISHIERLRPMAKSLHYDVINPMLRKMQSLSDLLGSKPLSVPYFYSTKLQKDIDDLLDHHDVECIFCYSSSTAEYVFNSRHSRDKLRKIRCIMDFVDMDSYKWRQYAENTPFPMGWVYRNEAKRLLEYETRIVGDFDHAIMVSDDEKKLFQNQISCEHISTVGNGVDHDFFHPSHQSPLKKEGPVLVFTGMMDYRPNIEGIIWFVDKILPKVREQFNNITLYIVGNRPVPRIKRLGRKSGVIVTGFVEDVRDYLALADICIIPLLIARGIQNKVLEALSMGKATITTSAAASGITALNGRHLLVSDKPLEFANTISDLIRDRERREHLGRQARRFIVKEYNWEAKMMELEALLAVS